MIVTTFSATGPGKRWTKNDVPFQGGEVNVVQTLQRPGTEARLFVVRYTGWLDSSGGFNVVYHGSLKDLPQPLAQCEKQPEVAFSADGLTAEIREPGQPAKVIDVRTGQPAAAPTAPPRG
jgi:hypothetical protein